MAAPTAPKQEMSALNLVCFEPEPPSCFQTDSILASSTLASLSPVPCAAPSPTVLPLLSMCKFLKLSLVRELEFPLIPGPPQRQDPYPA